jgi:hypothetical protein
MTIKKASLSNRTLSSLYDIAHSSSVLRLQTCTAQTAPASSVRRRTELPRCARIIASPTNMNRIAKMNNKFLPHRIAAFLLASASLFFGTAAHGTDIVQNVGGVSYVSGGVGTESLDRLNALAGDFNVKLVFALKSGEYLTDVRVAIADAAGKTVIDTASEGPWFLIKLPAGDYQIVATISGKTEKRHVAVGSAILQTIDFRWATE